METPGNRWDLASAFQHDTALVEGLRRLVSPHNPPEHIVQKARAVIEDWPEEAKVRLVNSHPLLGAPRSSLTGASRREQSGHDDEATMTELARLNAEYERRFGFRFVTFVNGRLHGQILPVIRRRLKNTRDDELETAIEEYLAIARVRLEQQREERV
jgi:2-oxo-4-hydroxy-4-carboxy--5-ureidoimidazoline (OHCU) decarboxylase